MGNGTGDRGGDSRTSWREIGLQLSDLTRPHIIKEFSFSQQLLKTCSVLADSGFDSDWIRILHGQFCAERQGPPQVFARSAVVANFRSSISTHLLSGCSI